MDHTAAVICVDYAPTGKEIVTGSYDKTIRIYNTGIFVLIICVFEMTNLSSFLAEGHSREVYHTKRMQRLTCVAWTKDNK